MWGRLKKNETEKEHILHAVVPRARGARLPGEVAQGVHECGRLVGRPHEDGLVLEKFAARLVLVLSEI